MSTPPTPTVIADSEPAAPWSNSSPSHVPSVAVIAPVEPVRRAKPAARTYGRRVADPAVEQAAAPAVGLGELGRHSTVVIPETDPEVCGMDDDAGSECDELSEGEGGSPRQPSSPTMRKQQVYSTDPTEDDDEGYGSKGINSSPVVARPAGAGSALFDSSSSDEEGGEEEVPAVARMSVKDQLALMDKEFDELDSTNPTQPALAVPVPFSMPSSLTAPTTSDATTSNLGASSSSVLDTITRFLPPTSTASKATEGSTSDSEDEAPSKLKKRPRIVDSEEEEDEEADDSIEASPVKVVALTQRERLEAMAAKKKAFIAAVAKSRSPSVVPSDREEEEDEVEEEETKVPAKKEKKKPRGMSRKEVEEMNKTTAAMGRNQNPRLERNVVRPLQVGDVAKRAPANIAKPSVVIKPKIFRPLSSIHPTAPPLMPASDPIASSSGSEIQDPRTDSPGPPVRRVTKTITLTSSIDAIPVPSPVARRKPGEAFSDDDDVLPEAGSVMMAVMDEKKLAAEQAAKSKRWEEQKSRAAKANITISDDDGSDSDIEIIGTPVLLKRPEKKAATVADAVNTPRLTPHQRELRTLSGPAYGKKEVIPTESQVFASAHTFGKPFGSTPSAAPSSTLGGNKPRKARIVFPVITQSSLEAELKEKMAQQNIDRRTKKEMRYRRDAEARLDAQVVEEGIQAIGAKDLLATKAAKLQAAKERGEMDVDEDEDAGDEDFELGKEEDGNGSEVENDGGEDEEGGSGSEAENVEPSHRPGTVRAGSHTTSEDDKQNARVEDDEEDDEESIAVGPRSRARPRAVINDEEEEDGDESQAGPAIVIDAVPRRMELPAFLDDGDGGFSQFFGTAFSQDVGGKNNEEGFHREDQAAVAPEPTLRAPVLIDSADLADDAEELEAGNAFRAPEPATPREAEPLRHYYNKSGFMTQTRPANLFEASPSDSPSDSVASTIRRRAPDSESQRMTQTQLEATQTPTQAPRGLQRSHALIDDDSFDFEMAATEVQPEPTEVEPETQETQSEMDYYPSAAQPTRTVVDPPRQNAFAVLLASKQAQGPEPGRVEKQGKNAFVDTEADMSEDEYGFGKASGDEDEAGMDAELESLVDNDEVDRDLGEEQDALAQQRYMEDQAKAESEALAKAQRLAAGEERLKRKGGLGEFDDDDFDDDHYGQSRRNLNKRARVENATMAELGNAEETQQFANAHKDGLTVPHKELEFDYLNTNNSDGERDDDGSSDDDAPRMTAREANLLAVQASKRRQAEGARSPSPKIHTGISSSPREKYTVSTKTRRPQLSTVSEHRSDSYSLLGPRTKLDVWRTESKDESQSGTTGANGGSGSSVTGFIRANDRAKAAYGGVIEAGKNGKSNVAPRPSKMGFRKNKFA